MRGGIRGKQRGYDRSTEAGLVVGLADDRALVLYHAGMGELHIEGTATQT